MKRITALFLVATLLCLTVCGCVNGYYTRQLANLNAGRPIEPYEEPTTATAPTEPPSATEETAPQNQEPLVLEGEDGQMQFVMIYNPRIYREGTGTTGQLYAGDFSAQIEIPSSRAPVAPIDPGYTLLSTREQSVLPSGIGTAANPAAYVHTYQQGETRDFFYCTDISVGNMSKDTFTCLYAGNRCNVWVLADALDDQTAAMYGQEFDSRVYDYVVQLCGKPRFFQNGTKVNLLYYPMSASYGGYFTTADIFSSDEISAQEAESRGFNLDHAIIHFNSNLATDPAYQTFMRGTLAHEFQHLIFGTDAVESAAQVTSGTWINEAFSGYVEEALYPGSKEEGGHIHGLLTSEGIQGGQSLYNFESDGTVGVYGSVYMFSHFLVNLGGEDVLHSIHSYWRDSDSLTLCDAEAIYQAFDSSAHAKVDNAITYPAHVTFDTDYEAWMSKLTLRFYLSLLSQDSGSPDAYRAVDPLELVYSTTASTNIQGGGRVIIAVKNGIYEIPADADAGLVYIGLDKDFQPVTDFVCS